MSANQQELFNTEEATEVVIEPQAPEAAQTSEPVDNTLLQQEVVEEVIEQPAVENEEAEQYSANVKKRIDKLTYKAKEAERREQAALQYAQSMKSQNEQLTQNQTQVDGSYLDEMESRIKFQEENLKGALQKAIESGDVEAQIQINKDLAKHALDSERLAYAKSEREKTNDQNQGLAAHTDAQPPQPQQQEQPISPEARAWAGREENAWFGSDEVMTLAAFSLHNGLAAEGWQVNSDDYWKELDNRLHTYFPNRIRAAQAQTNAQSNTQSKRPSQVAPANRVKTNSKGRKTIKLTESEEAIARKLDLTNEQYAKEVVKMQNNQT